MSRPTSPREYILGADPEELDRLRVQHETWREVSDEAFDRAGVSPGWKILDAGCGPGMVLADLWPRVAPDGELWGVDQSQDMLDAARQRGAEAGAPQLRLLRATLPDAELPRDYFDLIWVRWVLSFPPDADSIIARLAASLRPGGLLLVQDYNHDGVGLWPESRAFHAAIEAARELYRRSGGDPWIGTRLPALARAAGLVPEDYRATVLTGGPEAPVFRWAQRFFTTWAAKFQEHGLLTAAQAEEVRADWQARAAEPDARFFSPIVVTASARRSS